MTKFDEKVTQAQGKKAIEFVKEKFKDDRVKYGVISGGAALLFGTGLIFAGIIGGGVAYLTSEYNKKHKKA